MKMAMRDSQIMIKEADPTQMAVIKSWNKMKWNKSTQMLEGPADLETLNKLVKLVRLSPVIETYRLKLESVQQAIDLERTKKEPKPYVPYPVTKNLYEHQVRAANMALLEFGMIDPAEVSNK